MVPLESPINDNCPDSLIVFIDVSDPENPVLRSWFDPGTVPFGSAGVVAVTPQLDGRFLMILTGGSNEVLRFYRSTGSDLGGGWEFVFDYEDDDIDADTNGNWPEGDATSNAYQMMNFVREESGTVFDDGGQLYLFAARNSWKTNDGADQLDLYKVNEGNDSFSFEWVGRRHLVAEPTTGAPLGKATANFNAASGIYVSPAGNILLYATEHENDGPDGTVKAGEWRHRKIVRDGSPTLRPAANAGGPYNVNEGASIQLDATAAPPLTRAWVELFADEDFQGRSVIIDHPDRDRDDFDNFDKIEAEFGDLNGFSDDATAMLWFAPKGCTFTLHEHASGAGLSRTVVGDGAVHQETDLGVIDDEISSITWSPNCKTQYEQPATLDWDLDGDNVFETTGATPTFSAQTLDGPTTRAVMLRATPAGGGAPVFATATVRIANVAPSLSGVGAVDSLGNPLGPVTPFVLAGLPVTVNGSFTDPGVADTHTASVAWGDNVVDEGAAQGSFAHTHTYTQPGGYQAVATVTDDDGGTATQPITIDVVDPAAAIEGIADQLEDLLDDGYSPTVNDALSEAVQQLLGSGDGKAASGALDKLQDGDTEAAIVKLIAAVQALQQAEATGGPDLDATIDLLGLIGQALAQGAHAEAQAALPSPSPGEQKQLDVIADLIATGITSLAGGDHVAALEDFGTAVHKAEALIS